MSYEFEEQKTVEVACAFCGKAFSKTPDELREQEMQGDFICCGQYQYYSVVTVTSYRVRVYKMED